MFRIVVLAVFLYAPLLLVASQRRGATMRTTLGYRRWLRRRKQQRSARTTAMWPKVSLRRVSKTGDASISSISSRRIASPNIRQLQQQLLPVNLEEAVDCISHRTAMRQIAPFRELYTSNGDCIAEADPDSCAGGCCRVALSVFCDVVNDYQPFPCVCNRNTVKQAPPDPPSSNPTVGSPSEQPTIINPGVSLLPNVPEEEAAAKTSPPSSSPNMLDENVASPSPTDGEDKEIGQGVEDENGNGEGEGTAVEGGESPTPTQEAIATDRTEEIPGEEEISSLDGGPSSFTPVEESSVDEHFFFEGRPSSSEDPDTLGGNMWSDDTGHSQLAGGTPTTEAVNTWDGAKVDENGCIGSAGQSWCPELSACIQPWLENCPVADAATFSGPTSVSCDSDMRCSVSEECIIDLGGFTIGGPYISGINGTLDLPDGCVANCTGCDGIGPLERIPDLEAPATSDDAEADLVQLARVDLKETVKCLSLAEAMDSKLEYFESDLSCLEDGGDGCELGCCRLVTVHPEKLANYLYCDHENATPEYACLCNMNTALSTGS